MNIRKPKLRRSYLRRSVHRQLEVICRQGDASGLQVNTYVLDLSEAGARLLLTAAPRDELVHLALYAPGYPRPLTRRARIVWSLSVNDRDHVVGIQFQEFLNDADVLRVTVPVVKLKF